MLLLPIEVSGSVPSLDSPTGGLTHPHALARVPLYRLQVRPHSENATLSYWTKMMLRFATIVECLLPRCMNLRDFPFYVVL